MKSDHAKKQNVYFFSKYVFKNLFNKLKIGYYSDKSLAYMKYET